MRLLPHLSIGALRPNYDLIGLWEQTSTREKSLRLSKQAFLFILLITSVSASFADCPAQKSVEFELEMASCMPTRFGHAVVDQQAKVSELAPGLSIITLPGDPIRPRPIEGVSLGGVVTEIFDGCDGADCSWQARALSAGKRTVVFIADEGRRFCDNRASEQVRLREVWKCCDISGAGGECLVPIMVVETLASDD